jgi:hypothetical protein
MALVGLQSHPSVLLTAAQPARNATVVRADIVPDTQPKHHPLFTHISETNSNW